MSRLLQLGDKYINTQYIHSVKITSTFIGITVVDSGDKYYPIIKGEKIGIRKDEEPAKYEHVLRQLNALMIT